MQQVFPQSLNLMETRSEREKDGKEGTNEERRAEKGKKLGTKKRGQR